MVDLGMEKLIDLTHTVSANIPTWDGNCGFNLNIDIDYKDCSPPELYRTQRMETRAGIGTHIDAPAHFFPDGATVDTISIKDLVTDLVVVKVSDVADEDYLVLPNVIEQFERKNGKILPRSFVMFYTGWSSYWDSPAKYQNNLKFPAVHESTAKLLLERGIVGLGIDTLSPDAGGKAFPVHRALLGKGKYLVENVANTNDLPATGSKIFIMPLKIAGATEAPVRMMAMV